MRHNGRSRLCILLVFVMVVTMTGESFALGAPGAEKPAELLMNEFPVLPPDARKKFELTSQDPTAVADLAIADFFQLVADILKMNIVIADRSQLDGKRVGIVMRDMSIEEAVHLVLQMNDLKAVHFNENTLIVMGRDSKAAYGIKQAKTFRLRFTTIDKVREYVTLNRNIQRQLGDNITFDAANNSIVSVDTAENQKLLASVVSQIDAPPAKLLEGVKLSYLDFAQFQTLARALGTDVQNRLAAMGLSYNVQGRLLMVYGTPEDIGLIRSLVGKLDVAPKQVLIDTSFLQVSSSFNREFGFKFTNNSFTVNQFDRLKDIERINANNTENNVFPTRTQINYLISKTGAKTIQSPKVRAIDNTAATINIGEIRNIQIQSTATTQGQGNTPGQQQTTFNTQEVPIGVQVNVTPTIHNDDSVTLDMRISVTKVLEIKSFGVDRTTQDSTTKLRIRNGETVVLGGFINQVLNTDDTPIPILGEIPLLEKIFRNKKREQSDSELVFLLTPYILDFQDKIDEKIPGTAPAPEHARSAVTKAAPSEAAPAKLAQPATAPKPAVLSNLPDKAKESTALAAVPSVGELGKPVKIESTTTRVVESKVGTAKVVFDSEGKVVQQAFERKGQQAAATVRPVPGTPATAVAPSTAGARPGKIILSDEEREQLKQLAELAGSAAPVAPAVSAAKVAAGSEQHERTYEPADEKRREASTRLESLVARASAARKARDGAGKLKLAAASTPLLPDRAKARQQVLDLLKKHRTVPKAAALPRVASATARAESEDSEDDEEEELESENEQASRADGPTPNPAKTGATTAGKRSVPAAQQASGALPASGSRGEEPVTKPRASQSAINESDPVARLSRMATAKPPGPLKVRRVTVVREAKRPGESGIPGATLVTTRRTANESAEPGNEDSRSDALLYNKLKSLSQISAAPAIRKERADPTTEAQGVSGGSVSATTVRPPGRPRLAVRNVSRSEVASTATEGDDESPEQRPVPRRLVMPGRPEAAGPEAGRSNAPLKQTALSAPNSMSAKPLRGKTIQRDPSEPPREAIARLAAPLRASKSRDQRDASVAAKPKPAPDVASATPEDPAGEYHSGTGFDDLARSLEIQLGTGKI